MGDSWRSRYAGLIYAVLSAFLIAGFFAFTNLFRYADGLVYDAMVRLTAGEQPADELLLIEAGAGHRDDGDKTWLTLLRELEKLGARKIAFTFVPQGVSAAFYDYARQQGNVVFGRRVIAAVGQTSQESIEPWPSQAGKELPFGVLTLPLAEYGVYRWHRSFVQIGGTRYPTLEQTAASRSDSVDRPTPPDRFLINFEVGSGRLPRLTLSRLLAGGAIPELVKNRVVLIGFASTSEIPGVKTPISPPGMTTSLLDVRGAALHTLLTGRFIHRPGLPALFGMLLVVTLVSLLVFHWLDSRRATVSASLAIFAAYVLTGLYLFKTVQLWLPIVALASAQLLFFVLFYREKAMLHDETMRAMLLELSEELKKRVTPASFYETREHWQQVANMLYQTLDLERLILLERVEGDHRLREVQALNCSLDDIEERRRDYERQPYKRAIEENGPVRLERQYLRNRGEGEEEYLVPLVFAGDVMGFWAFTV
ncbi:MAG: CHASE2 domain-containing protein, partial [Deltaproteobacteria bacterium]